MHAHVCTAAQLSSEILAMTMAALSTQQGTELSADACTLGVQSHGCSCSHVRWQVNSILALHMMHAAQDRHSPVKYILPTKGSVTLPRHVSIITQLSRYLQTVAKALTLALLQRWMRSHVRQTACKAGSMRLSTAGLCTHTHCCLNSESWPIVC
jgi:hypothetical protein